MAGGLPYAIDLRRIKVLPYRQFTFSGIIVYESLTVIVEYFYVDDFSAVV